MEKYFRINEMSLDDLTLYSTIPITLQILFNASN